MRKRYIKVIAGIAAAAVCLCMAFLFSPVYADTDGTELKITDQPDKLVIQLGAAWAGVKFELKTDQGLYPQPVVVSPEGILSMELGGSKTYILSALNSSVPVPAPDAPAVRSEQATESTALDNEPLTMTQEGTLAQRSTPAPLEIVVIAGADNEGDTQPKPKADGIPGLHLVLFIGGIVICVATLIIMRIAKNRKTDRYDDARNCYDDE